jgi:thiol-disulfide isomerase/thioredoxin
MARSDKGKEAWRRRQKRLEQRHERKSLRKQRNLLAISVCILLAASAVAVIGSIRAKNQADTNPTSWRLPKLSGKGNVALSQFRGKPTVVTFYASWCQDCQAQLTEFARIAKQVKGKVNFVAIDTQETNTGAAVKLASAAGIASWPIARDVGGKKKSSFHDQFKGSAPETTLFYDKNGQLLQPLNVPAAIQLPERLKTLYGLKVQ